MKPEDSFYIKVLIWAYERSANGFLEKDLLEAHDAKYGSIKYKLYLKLFRDGNFSNGNTPLIDHFDTRGDGAYWCLSEKGMSSAIDYLELKEAKRTGVQGFWMALGSIVIGVAVGIAQIYYK